MLSEYKLKQGGYLAIKILNSVFMLVKQQQALKGLKNEKYKGLRK